VNANDGVPVEVDDVVVGVENEKREEDGIDVAFIAVVTAGAVGNENVDGAAALVFAVLVEGVENEKKEADGALAVVVVIAAGAAVSAKRDEF
jgi:hypothetical protein